MKAHHEALELITPEAILNECTQLMPTDTAYLEHDLIQRFGSPEQPIYVDGSSDALPLIMPIYNGQLEHTQSAVLIDGEMVDLTIDGENTDRGLAKGFARYGDFDHAKPVIITYSLEAFFKVAQTGYAVALVVLPTLCSKHQTELKASDFKQIQFVINQLSAAGYRQLYLPVRLEHINLEPFKALEQNTAVRLLNLHHEILGTESIVNLDQYEETDFLKEFIAEGIELLPEKTNLPKGHLAKPFKMDDNSFLHIMDSGLYLIKKKRDDDGEVKQTRTFISHSAIVLGEARSLNNDNWKRVIQFHDKDNTLHRLLIPYEHFMGEAQEALKIIANHGLMPPRQAYKKNAFINYIQDYPIEQRFRCVERAGWYGNRFVTTNRTYGNGTDEELLFHSEMKDPYSTLGSFEGWQELSRLIEPHSLAVLTFSCAFSGQLVLPLNAESGGFHIYGTSSHGKSTITKASCGIWGKPEDFSQQWLTTDNALENTAELRNDSFLNLDELSQQTNPKSATNIIYMVTSGQGKARSSKTGKNRESKQFRLMYTSTGEVTLEEFARRANINIDAGLLLRFAHLSSDAGKGYGVFDCINYGTHSKDVGNRINELASQHYGHAGIKWLEYITSDDAVMLKAQELLDSFIEQHTQTKNGQANRVLRRFALVAVAGELATLAGITGWQKGRAFEAIAQCFNTWLGSLGSGENMEETKILEHIKAFFESNGTSRFEDLTVIRQADGEVIRPRIHNRVGYYDPESKVYLVSTIMFKKEMCIGMNETNAKKVLKANGWLECEDGRYTKRISNKLPDGARPTMMHFKVDAIQNFNS